MIRRIVIALACLGLVGAALLAAGCAKKLGPAPNANQAPKTTIFVQGPVDSVNHVVHLYWYGADPDGYVKRYQLRLVNPQDPDPAHQQPWFTTRTDSVFTIYSPNGGAAPTLYVAAEDDKGLLDPTPAQQLFEFRNRPPVVAFTTYPNRSDLSDTTFASVTVSWSIQDADGDATRASYRLWLDPAPGDPIDYMTTTSTTFTVPSSKFGTIAGYSTKRTLYLQAIDDGGMASDVVSVQWNVRRPGTGTRARVLIIDDVPSSGGIAERSRCDSLFYNAVRFANHGSAFVTPDQIAHLSLGNCQPFKSAADIEQTFKLFETVIWFRGYVTPFYSSTLSNYYDGIGPYLDAGGKLYLESMSLVSDRTTNGAIPLSFFQKYANVSGLFYHMSTPDSLAVWSVANRRTIQCPGVSDSLRTVTAVGGSTSSSYSYGVNCFVTLDPSQILIAAAKDSLTEGNPIPMPVALNVTRTNGNGGRLIVNTFPLAATSAPPATQRATVVAQAIMRILGLDH